MLICILFISRHWLQSTLIYLLIRNLRLIKLVWRHVTLIHWNTSLVWRISSLTWWHNWYSNRRTLHHWLANLAWIHSWMLRWLSRHLIWHIRLWHVTSSKKFLFKSRSWHLTTLNWRHLNAKPLDFLFLLIHLPKNKL